jgi:hypothetical protein
MRKHVLSGLAAALGLIGSMTLAAAQDVKAGWSVDIKPKRAILSYAAEDNGPRLLIMACLRDTDEFGLYSSGIMTSTATKGGIMAMQLVNGGVKYTVRGEPGIDGTTNQPAFRYETNIDSRALGLIRNDLMPIFTNRGPIVITIGKEERKIPVAGVAEPLRKFQSACFGR